MAKEVKKEEAKKEETKSGEDQKPEVKKPAYEVITDFRDINNFNVEIKAGSDVSHFDELRLNELVRLGIVKKND